MTFIAAIRSPGAIALIGACAGVAGAVLGALAGGWSTYRIEGSRQSFERQRSEEAEARANARTAAAVKGAVRLWRMKFTQYAGVIREYHVWHGHGDVLWWVTDMEMEMNSDDVKAIGTEATDDEWSILTRAVSAVRAIEGFRRDYYALPEDRRPLKLSTEKHGEVVTSEKEEVPIALEAIEEAIDVLDAMAARLEGRGATSD